MRRSLALVALIATVPLASASAQSVTDGDTIKLHGTTYRLWGIDAPETKQWCGDYPAGVMAAAVLETLTKGSGPVTCERKDTDRYGRTVAVCRVDGRDLGKVMVQLGFAWAFTRYSLDYARDEAIAKAEIWGYTLKAARSHGSGERRNETRPVRNRGDKGQE